MEYKDATTVEINNALIEAQQSFKLFQKQDRHSKASFLRTIASEMEARKQDIVKMAMEETHLAEPRIAGEFARTTGQLYMFASLIEEGSWVEARIDTAIPDRKPAPKPDLRKMSVPIGPVVVFGASNFPMAYSTAGGDTASAFAAGCPVIVKAHPAHANTSELVAQCVFAAIDKTKMPKGIFAHLHGKGFEVGKALVMHPITKAVGFTGSLTGGKALFDLAAQREAPIPVFSEMGSTNPVFILPCALKSRPKAVAEMYAASITLSVGQFCTNPGLLLSSATEGLAEFEKHLGALIKQQQPATMLHPGIASSYHKNKSEALKQPGVTVVAEADKGNSEHQAEPTLATVSVDDFINNPVLAEEVFGPYSILIKGDSVEALKQVLAALPGQLTATIIGDDEDFQEYESFIDDVREKAGRIILNGVPTGVEVCPSMHHGGPFPATTDSRFTSVGTDAIKRFVRPVCFQNFTQQLLPLELQDGNPLAIWRLVNSEWTNA